MVSSSALIEVIAERLNFYGAKNIVVDPVMVATSGARLIAEDAIETLKAKLLPIADVLTPNIPEAEELSGLEIVSAEDMIKAAEAIGEKISRAVLVKGGHQTNDANDLLYYNHKSLWFKGRRINNPNTHGTGCTLSSAIAANLAKGYSVEDSVQKAKDYLSGALAAMADFGIIGCAKIDFHPERCIGCGACVRACKKGATRVLEAGPNGMPLKDACCCVGCGECVRACPTGAWSRNPKKFYRVILGGRTGRQTPRTGKMFLNWADEDVILGMI